MRHPLQPRPARHDSTPHQSERSPSQRWVSILAGIGIGGALAIAGSGATVGAGVSSTTYTIGLDTAVADPGEDCPVEPGAYWHFVLAPNGQGNFAFTGMVLDLDGEATDIAPADLLPNGEQWDNVFVEVPAGSTLASLRTTMSTASYTSDDGDQAKRWNLSHTCPGDVPEGEPEIVVDETVVEETVVDETVVEETDPTVATTVPLVEVDETVAPTTAVPTSTTSTTTTSTTTPTTTIVAAAPPTATVAAAGPVPASPAAASAASAAGSIGAAAGGTLPTTGGSPLPFTQAACWVVVLGCCLVALHRRRRSTAG